MDPRGVCELEGPGSEIEWMWTDWVYLGDVLGRGLCSFSGGGGDCFTGGRGGMFVTWFGMDGLGFGCGVER
jgi:hypothetical protein